MIKPGDLRQHLTTALAELQREPDKLRVFIDAGKIVSTGVPNLSFEYRYTLNVLVTDYAGHPDAVMVPLLEWISRNQSELLHNPDGQDIRFEAELLDADRVDLSIELPLTERVGVHPRIEGGYTVEHYPEPQLEPGWPAAHWQVFLRDDLIAEWDVPA